MAKTSKKIIKTINLDESKASSSATTVVQEIKDPILFLDVNLGDNRSSRIVIYEGEDYN